MSNKITKKIIGTIELPNKIDITDPCYDRNVWCRINDLKIQAGEYTCIVWMRDERVRAIGIYLNGIIPLQKSMEMIGEIGVDAGLAGFFIDKPDYDNKEWLDFCHSLQNKDFWLREGLGFFSSSGYGDGSYPVYVARDKKGEIVSVKIRFI